MLIDQARLRTKAGAAVLMSAEAIGATTTDAEPWANRHKAMPRFSLTSACGDRPSNGVTSWAGRAKGPTRLACGPSRSSTASAALSSTSTEAEFGAMAKTGRSTARWSNTARTACAVRLGPPIEMFAGSPRRIACTASRNAGWRASSSKSSRKAGWIKAEVSLRPTSSREGPAPFRRRRSSKSPARAPRA